MKPSVFELHSIYYFNNIVDVVLLNMNIEMNLIVLSYLLHDLHK